MWDRASAHGEPKATVLACESGKAGNQRPKPDTTESTSTLYMKKVNFFLLDFTHWKTV